APGYTAVIKRPMDFTTIRARLDAGGYRSWDALADDMVLMFDNAMQFNRPDTVYHKQAKTLADMTRKLVELGRSGVTDFRGRTAGIARTHNAALAAEQRAALDRRRAAARSAKQAAKAAKVAQRAAEAGITVLLGADVDARGLERPLTLEENRRAFYRPRLGPAAGAPWRALALGANGDGLPFACRPALHPADATPLPPNAHAASVARFTAGLPPALRELAR
ncbi:hypothetical protein WJX81_007117, partial [Elliptochloris bilobata]